MVSEAVQEFFIPQIKGRIESYIAREKEPLSKLVKYIRTMQAKYEINMDELSKILNQVKKSIDPFLDPHEGLYRPERLDRYNKLREELGI